MAAPSIAHTLSLSARIGGNVVAFRAKGAPVDTGARTWVEIVPELGEFKGHAAGAFEWTREVFDQIVLNFSRQKNPIPVYYGHPRHDTGMPVPGAGWVIDLEVRGESLWGLVELTARAAAMVRAGELNFNSPVCDFASIDRKTGEPVGAEILELGMVNNPFLDSQTPVALSRSEGMNMDAKKAVAAVAKALGLDESASPEAMVNALAAMLALADPEPKKEEPAAEEVMPEMAKEREAPAVACAVATQTTEEAQATATADAPADGAQDAARIDVAKALEQLSGLDPVALLALIDQKREAIAAALGAAEAAPAADQAAALSDVRTVAEARIAAMSKAIDDNKTKIAKLEAELETHRMAATERRIDDAIAAGKVLDKDRARLVNLARRAPECLDEWLDGPAVVPTGRVTAPAAASPDAVIEFDTEHPLAKMLAIQLARAVPDEQERKRIIGDRVRALTAK